MMSARGGKGGEGENDTCGHGGGDQARADVHIR